MCPCDGGDRSHNDGHETVSAHGPQSSSHKLKGPERDNHGSMVKYQEKTLRLHEKQTHDMCRRHTKPTLSHRCSQLLAASQHFFWFLRFTGMAGVYTPPCSRSLHHIEKRAPTYDQQSCTADNHHNLSHRIHSRFS